MQVLRDDPSAKGLVQFILNIIKIEKKNSFKLYRGRRRTLDFNDEANGFQKGKADYLLSNNNFLGSDPIILLDPENIESRCSVLKQYLLIGTGFINFEWYGQTGYVQNL